ncbi:DUF2855 family protein [Wenzhouxiangella marina]|uniref:Uncharacterized protein n=1 Tax=Wenzhouxiangella marina TaxID=1579979 RepID=A0A0K0Y006_9GAMM|nr:DUF2855 family protein [Wenzhouxiangella marina]AKS43222.1 hypothetical protein WM2015_2865 [Wenzhouxiangella marina]MBB6087091.1 hypothetical protein [Wenzhouxiangella marina]
MTETQTRLLMNRQRFEDMHVDSTPAPSAKDGEVVLALDRFSLTVNNVTYAAFGEALRYWDFFPTGIDGQGLLPVWGYANVVDSEVEGIEVGQRYFGYFPSATHLVVKPGKTGARSFRDESAHRADLPEVYNWYQRSDNDPFQSEAAESLHAIFRPLFVTAFGLSDFLADENFFGAKQVVISSASSRTGYSEAFSLRMQSEDIELIGLTSAGHRDFVEGLGLYSKVLAYDDLEQLDPDRPTVYVDVAGNTEVQRRVHQHFGEQLVHDAALGAAHTHEPPQPDEDLPGARPVFFFAPVWVARRQKEWGPEEFNRRVGEAVAAFFQHVMKHRLIEIREQQGFEAAREVLTEMLDGRTDPAIGHVIRLKAD